MPKRSPYILVLGFFLALTCQAGNPFPAGAQSAKDKTGANASEVLNLYLQISARLGLPTGKTGELEESTDLGPDKNAERPPFAVSTTDSDAGLRPHNKSLEESSSSSGDSTTH